MSKKNKEKIKKMRNFAQMKIKIVIFLLFLAPGRLLAGDTLSLLFVGDVMMHQLQINAAKTPSGYALDECFDYIRPVLSGADITIANFETTLAGEPYSGYPAFCAPDELPAALLRAGVDVLVTANNHSCDKGKKGIVRTLTMLDSLGIHHTGTFLDTAQRRKSYPLLLERHGMRIALLNYTYGTNDIPVPSSTVVNLIDTLQMAADIEVAKNLKPDVIIAVMHWGEEYRLKPGKEQRALAAFLQRNGVPLVIGGHPHVLQPMELQYTVDSSVTGAVVYSLGNFISNQTRENTEIGATVSLRLVKKDNVTTVCYAGYSFTWTYKPVIDGKRRFYVLPAARYENDPSFFSTREHYDRMISSLEAMREFYEQSTIGFVEEK